jgi:signal transduction histidine kinase
MTLLRGKLGGLIAFVGIAALVGGGLGWATHQALELEEARRIAAAQAEEAEKLRQQQMERAEKLRLALWRLDSRLVPALAREDSRPYPQYAPLHSPFPALTSKGTAVEPGQVYLPSPLLTADLPEWMQLHFQIDKLNGWMSPQVIPPEVQKTLRKQPIELALHNVTPEREELLKKLQQKYPWATLVTTLQDRGIAVEDRNPNFFYLNNGDQQVPQGLFPNTPPGATGFSNVNGPANPTNSTPGAPQSPNLGGQINLDQQQTRSQAQSQTTNPSSNNNDFQEFINRSRVTWRASREGQGGYQFDGRNFANGYPAKMTLTEQPVDVELGSMRPIWLPDALSPEHLIMVRATHVGDRPVYQGVVLDWARLQVLLKDEINDLFPEARLRPIPIGDPDRPDRTMTALPVELEPGEAPLPEHPRQMAAEDLPPAGWTPLRIGLVFAWVAAAVALLAVGLGGWSLFNLSERRIRFVSAVTHELRTPLTTLRLYLDLMTSGMVNDPQQREEYLKTMHGETDRLNRLIANVLDFARLEKQRPTVEKRPVPIAELLEQVRQTWTERCAAAGKDLVVANDLPADDAVCTDRNLVEQILGNLIDNARKYSRDAADPRIWLRAVRDADRVVLEVEDRGPGVTKRERGSIFRPFRRGHDADAKAGGVGLGLALATRWACFIGGRLTVRAGEGNIGACFRLEL